MSSVLPSTNKVRHYQEISGFFVAYFRSDGSFTCSPKTSTEANRQSNSLRQSDENRDEDAEVRIGGHSESNGLEEIDQACGREEEEKEKRYSVTVQRSRPEGEAELLQLQPHLKTVSESLSSLRATPVAEGNALCQEPLSSATKEADMDDDSPSVDPSSNSNASLSVHAFSLDTTWPVPRMLAQAFWFPHAHGIIYIVDATRKNDPRGIDHLLNARQFLASLVMDPHFKRKDIPIVVFANKAGLNDETCFRVDEIADILGCEEWEDERDRIVLQVADLNDVSNEGTTARTMTTSGRSNIEAGAESRPVLRPWCVKSTRSDGEGEGLRESVEWLKSRMGEIWKST
ncbi:hypothetical protein BCR41DRAFT_385739 [Lobosporangium transversale]|uniref:P-loop containing nucleoside triphosphate hydrolase protein n=1 Tax=Lobosporangium transversale TaxID=64571 RepID=A0A1Y2GQA5_9FUNG|nr:hypothetical protein BCR41DRAFT_385739 [Lobosporangium transversale]ORZ19089.1 hypothetical protein BCR41DRAFT_385739 [Lobosporangium transversale]|eukprot:XP_021882257.1 hypothetical protein BCR41DRAFT_385739 [Lobosporangium transversale]